MATPTMAAAAPSLPAASTPTILSRAEMERRRLEAGRCLQAGAKQSWVVANFGVTRTTASRWAASVKRGGTAALKLRKAPGRPSRLTPNEAELLRALYAAGPRAAGFEQERWTSRLVAMAIQDRFHVRYDDDHVSRLILKLGLRQKRERRHG